MYIYGRLTDVWKSVHTYLVQDNTIIDTCARDVKRDNIRQDYTMCVVFVTGIRDGKPKTY